MSIDFYMFLAAEDGLRSDDAEQEKIGISRWNRFHLLRPLPYYIGYISRTLFTSRYFPPAALSAPRKKATSLRRKNDFAPQKKQIALPPQAISVLKYRKNRKE